MRELLLATVLIFIAVLAALTIHAVISGGPDILTAFSLLVLVMLGFGVVGALRHPPDG